MFLIPPVRLSIFLTFRFPFFFYSGSLLLSHTVSSAVPSAGSALTLVFGMGTRVSLSRIATRILLLSLFLLRVRPALPSASHSAPQQQNSNPTPTHSLFSFLRKEVIQPHLPIRLPCYDFTPVIRPAFGCSLLAVGSLTSGISDSHGVTGGVYKTRERIHRGILIRDY